MDKLLHLHLYNPVSAIGCVSFICPICGRFVAYGSVQAISVTSHPHGQVVVLTSQHYTGDPPQPDSKTNEATTVLMGDGDMALSDRLTSIRFVVSTCPYCSKTTNPQTIKSFATDTDSGEQHIVGLSGDVYVNTDPYPSRELKPAELWFGAG